MSPSAAQQAGARDPDEPRSWADRNREVVELGLAWVRQALEDYVCRLRTSAPRPALTGPAPEVMTDVQADWLLRELAAVPTPGGGRALDQARGAYDAARRALGEADEPAAIDRLSKLFGLAPFDEDVLLLALAPRLQAAFQALFGYAHDRLSLTRPTPHLALAMLAPEAPAWTDALARLGPAAPLRRFALITVEDSGADALAPLGLDERVAGYLLGLDDHGESVRLYVKGVAAGALPERHRPALEQLEARLGGGVLPAAMIMGPPRSGRRALAAALAERFGLGLAELEPRALPAEAGARRARFALIAREARLASFAVLIDASPAGPAASEGAAAARELAEDARAGLEALLLVVAEDRVPFSVPLPTVRLAALGAADRAALWRQALGASTPVAEQAIAAAAEQFALGPPEIAAVADAQSEATAPPLWTACREAAGRGLDALAERIEPHFGWHDIVLPESVRHDLRALVAQVRHRAQVYGSWGFDRRLPRGRGVSALFAGPSGVGKTMAAEVIAGELGLDLYRIDLSGVVSKYIGETEKNLRRVFDAAEAAGAVLFFDEADALFGKRTEVKDSHDRYANIEISYLLQRMEGYTGLAILATNLKRHLDEAFLRRLRYIIDLPFPDAALRRAIWERSFPPRAPVGELDFAALARLEIAGGSITVIAVNAAFLAAADGRPIGMEHVARAARSEFCKLDKEFRPTWLEPY